MEKGGKVILKTLQMFQLFGELASVYPVNLNKLLYAWKIDGEGQAKVIF